MDVFGGRVYNFTNENLVEYNKVYDFDNKSILSVLGSGDQYFSSVLYGAKEVCLYDINKTTYDFFFLKYYSILTLDYDDFYKFYVLSNLDDLDLYAKVKYDLPIDVKNNLDNILEKYGSLSCMLLKNNIYNANKDYLKYFIPYFNIDKYYELKYLLEKRVIPNIYFSDLINLYNELGNKKYDLMLTSNIYRYLNLDIYGYKELLNKFNVETIQSYYSWLFKPEGDFINNGFDLSEINSVFNNRKDYVLTLKKIKNMTIK